MHMQGFYGNKSWSAYPVSFLLVLIGYDYHAAQISKKIKCVMGHNISQTIWTINVDVYSLCFFEVVFWSWKNQPSTKALNFSRKRMFLSMHDSHCRVNQMYYGSYLQFLPLRQCSHGSFINLNLMDWPD
jgi:hypothetical protein